MERDKRKDTFIIGFSINTSRGELINTKAIIRGLKSEKIGYLGLDVYEQEEDLSDEVIKDDTFERLPTFPNVIITGHQAFFTKNAWQNIAETPLANITDLSRNKIVPMKFILRITWQIKLKRNRLICYFSIPYLNAQIEGKNPKSTIYASADLPQFVGEDNPHIG